MGKIPYTLNNSNLFYAAEIGDLEQVKHYIENGANLDYQEGKYTVLQVAVNHEHIHIVECLLQKGANPNLKSSETSMTALMLCESGKVLKLLAEYGADPRICDRSKNNALLYYANYNCIDAAEAWMELKWPTDCKEKMLHNRLLAQKKFDMLTVISGFIFKAESSIGKIAEFKSCC